ncbi:hypothetical protein GCM10011324_42760 [Allosediminivita pacifica]|nr:hypothetical protein GCM10011324_42760 [Allosediminivita pacifica]
MFLFLGVGAEKVVIQGGWARNVGQDSVGKDQRKRPRQQGHCKHSWAERSQATKPQDKISTRVSDGIAKRRPEKSSAVHGRKEIQSIRRYAIAVCSDGESRGANAWIETPASGKMDSVHCRRILRRDRAGRNEG